jgi:hypothetical protein
MPTKAPARRREAHAAEPARANSYQHLKQRPGGNLGRPLHYHGGVPGWRHPRYGAVRRSRKHGHFPASRRDRGSDFQTLQQPLLQLEGGQTPPWVARSAASPSQPVRSDVHLAPSSFASLHRAKDRSEPGATPTDTHTPFSGACLVVGRTSPCPVGSTRTAFLARCRFRRSASTPAPPSVLALRSGVASVADSSPRKRKRCPCCSVAGSRGVHVPVSGLRANPSVRQEPVAQRVDARSGGLCLRVAARQSPKCRAVPRQQVLPPHRVVQAGAP